MQLPWCWNIIILLPMNDNAQFCLMNSFISNDVHISDGIIGSSSCRFNIFRGTSFGEKFETPASRFERMEAKSFLSSSAAA